jgi:hypothetical protein
MHQLTHDKGETTDMNSATRARLLTLGALVLALAVTASAQLQKPAVAPCTAYSASQLISISADTTAQGVGVKAEPDPACVKRGTSVFWTSTQGDWDTDFSANSPFASGARGHVGKANETHGDLVKQCTKSDKNYDPKRGGCVHKYWVGLTPKGGKPLRKHPDIIIEPEL